MQNIIPSHKEFDALYHALRDVVMHQEFQSTLTDIQKSSGRELSQAVSTQLTQKQLTDSGVHIPEGFTLIVGTSWDSPILNTNEANSGPSKLIGFIIPLPFDPPIHVWIGSH